MRLFKCYDSYFIDDKDQVLVIWANDEYEALEKAATIHKNLDCYDDPYQTVLKDWKVEEYFIGDGDIFVCYPKDLNSQEDVRLISIPYDVQDVEKYVMDKLIEMASNEEYFRDHLQDKAVNMSFNERFFFDSKGWIFEPTPRLDGGIDVREDIKVKVLEDNMSIDGFIQNLWIDNVHDFFNDNEEYRDLYIEYITTDAEPDILNNGFFFYVCKKLMESKDWVEYTDIRKV